MVILGAIAQHARTHIPGLEVFLASASAHGEVVIVNRSPALVPLLARAGVEIVPAQPLYRIANGRFLDYLMWLDRNPVPYAALCDTLDVVVQRPLPLPAAEPGLIVAEEHKIIGACPYNAAWVSPEFHARPVICCGVILGSRDALLAYLEVYAKTVADWRGYDTSVLTAYAYRGGATILPYANDVCMHLGYAPPDRVRWHGAVQVEGRTPAIVHQYNRHPEVMAQVEARWI